MSFLTTSDIANTYGVTISAVNNWIHKGKLEAFKIGDQWRISEENLQKFLTTKPRRKTK
nr:MAG: pyocin activator protein [Bacteriophage sp.]